MSLKLKDLVQGTTRRIDLTFTDSTGVPYNLTGATVFFAATTEAAPTSDTTAAINVSTASHIAPTLGQSRIVLSASNTNIPVGTYNFGAQAVLADGTVVENTGTFKVKQQYKVATT
jgi:hypothetical protein